MKRKLIKEMMIPLSDYATVSETDTLEVAIKALGQARNNKKYQYKHRAVLALDTKGNVTGKLSMRDILKALEPKYRQFEHPTRVGSFGLSRFGFSNDFLNSLLENYSLWDEPIEQLVKKAGTITVSEAMYTPSLGEYVDQDAPLAEALHQFILGCHQSLLVVKGKDVVGIIRLSDLFNLVCNEIE